MFPYLTENKLENQWIRRRKLRTMITLVYPTFRFRDDGADEKLKQQVESKQYSLNTSLGANVPGSPSNSMHSGHNFPSTGSHMSPSHCLPTGMANLEKSETMPEIQMPSMASIDPNFRAAEQPYYTSIFDGIQL